MGRVIISGGSRATIPYVGPKASLTPTSGVTYTSGLSGLEPSEISSYAQAISNVTGATNDTTAMYIDYGDVHRKISVGDQVTIAVNSVNYAFDVIGFNHDDLTDSAAYGKATVSGKAGMTLGMHDCYATNRSMNAVDNNTGGWKSSIMRAQTMVTMKGYLPTAWQTIVKSVNKTSGVGGGAVSGIDTTSDDCFLLSQIEVFNLATSSFAGEGVYYAYYKAGNTTTKSNTNGNVVWWLRSPLPNDDMYFLFVNTSNGIGSGSSNTDRGLSFAFCI